MFWNVSDPISLTALSILGSGIVKKCDAEKATD